MISEKLKEAMDWLEAVDVHSEIEAKNKELLISTIIMLDKTNNELKRTYESVASNLFDKNQELSEYLYAQICPNLAWEIVDTIDYYAEYYKLKNKLEKCNKIIDLMAEEISKSIINTCPNADYNKDIDCEKRCSNDDDVIAECWKKYFERKVESGD